MCQGRQTPLGQLIPSARIPFHGLPQGNRIFDAMPKSSEHGIGLNASQNARNDASHLIAQSPESVSQRRRALAMLGFSEVEGGQLLEGITERMAGGRH